MNKTSFIVSSVIIATALSGLYSAHSSTLSTEDILPYKGGYLNQNGEKLQLDLKKYSNTATILDFETEPTDTAFDSDVIYDNIQMTYEWIKNVDTSSWL